MYLGSILVSGQSVGKNYFIV